MHLPLLWPLLALTLAASHSAAQQAAPVALPKLEWWQTTVFYHLYPRSFQDSDGDGVGDLKGIIERLPQHLSDLGIGAVWLSPIFKSPMRDFGYDISDYETFEPVFGDLEDFEVLKEKLHALDVKILLDFVPNHTSDQHEWFQKSLANIPPYSDFYVWAEPKGWNSTEPIPPNNWQSNFTGSAWTYAPQRQKFYLHHFQPQQPDLNYRNPLVVEAMHNVIKYWLRKGVDGFRVDAVNYLVEDAQLRDNPVEEIFTSDSDTPVLKQIEKYSKDLAENYAVVRGFSRVVDDFSKETDNRTRVLLNEAYMSVGDTMLLYNTGDNSIPLNFFFLIRRFDAFSTAQDFYDTINLWLERMPQGKWPNWSFDNHDNPRTATRMGPEMVDAINTLLLLLPGTPVLYYGQEIGMEDTTDIPWSAVQDPFAHRVGPARYKEFNRDPQRCPMQWDDSTSAGFSSNPHPWLPVNPNFYRLNVKAQREADVSHYKVVQRLIQLRRERVFQHGDVKLYVVNTQVLAFTRCLKGEPLFVVVINLDNFTLDVNLGSLHIDAPSLHVHTASVNSKYKIGDQVPPNAPFLMRPKACLILMTSQSNPKNTTESPLPAVTR